MKKKNLKKAFSLVEVLVTIFILSLSISAITLLMVVNFKNAQNSKNQIVASQLAQEGVELVRNLKDNGQLDGTPYNYTTEGTYANLKIDKNLLFFNTSGTGQLYLNSENFFAHSGTKATKFFRRMDLSVSGTSIVIPPTFSSRVITVRSYVTWNNTGLTSITSENCNLANKCVMVVSELPDLY